MIDLLLRPVAFVRSSRSSPEDDFWGATPARIELASHVPDDALDGIETFSHVEVLYHFHAVDPEKIIQGARHPRRSGARCHRRQSCARHQACDAGVPASK